MRAQFITAEEVQQILSVSRSKSYQIMAEASAEAAYPLGERNALLMRSVKSAFALLLTKVTKPAAERRKRVSIKIPQLWR